MTKKAANIDAPGGDIFTGLGDMDPGGGGRIWFNGLGDYDVEVVALKVITSEHPSTMGHKKFVGEVIVREVVREITAPPDGYTPSHPEGTRLSFSYNITKTPMALRNVRGIVDALAPVAGEYLTTDEMASLEEIEQGSGDVFAALAGLITQGDGQRFAGARMRVNCVTSGKPDGTYSRLYFHPPVE